MDIIKMIAKFVPQYITTPIALLTGPKRYIHGHNASEEDFHASLVFAGVSACIAIALTPRLLLPDTNIGSDLSSRMILGLSAALLGAAAIAGAFRLLGGRPPFRRLVVNYMYVSGVAASLLSVLSLLAVGVALAVDPEPVKQWFHLIREMTPFRPRPEDLKQFIELQSSAGVRVMTAGQYVYSFVGCVWLLACWGSFREVANVSRLRSAVAFVCAMGVMSILGVALSVAYRSL